VSISQTILIKAVKWQATFLAYHLQQIEKGFWTWRQDHLEPSVSSAEPDFTVYGAPKAERPSFECATIRIEAHKHLGIKKHHLFIDKNAYEATLLSVAPGHRLIWKEWVKKPNFSKPFVFTGDQDCVVVRRSCPEPVEFVLRAIWLATVAPWDHDELKRINEAKAKQEDYVPATKIELLESEMLKWAERELVTV
jgi:hypothetical protein